jgi:hypothetical protein
MACILTDPHLKTIRPCEEKKSKFPKEQDACRKYMERVFSVLQSRGSIVHHPARTWSVDTTWEVTTTCVIMHNMIGEDERDEVLHDQGCKFQCELV